MTEEAKWVLENMTLPEKGVFVEIGSFDGVEGSNTLPFEERGWTGLCVEADAYNAWRCAERRICPTLCAAIGSLKRIAPFIVNLEDRGLSGLDRPREDNTQQIFVPVLTLWTVLLSFFNSVSIDLLSIDTEGTEIDAWKSIGAVRPKIVIMEYYTLGKPSNEQAILNEMISCGYSLKWQNHLNMVFTYEK